MTQLDYSRFAIANVRLVGVDELVDIAVSAGRIEAVTPSGSVARSDLLDLDGMGGLVLPRFVDVHSHADARVWNPEISLAKSDQGIGLEVLGNCGLGPAPSGPIGGGWRAILSGVGIVGPSGWGFASLGEYVRELDRTNGSTPPRTRTLLPYGAVRASVGDLTRSLDDEQLLAVRHGIEAGLGVAVGVSMGLVYPPNDAADTRELETTLQPLAGWGTLAVHVRSQANFWIEAIEEVLSLARRLRIRLLISHLCVGGKRNQWKVDWVLARLRAAREAGLDVFFDQHPYSAGSTSMTQLIPAWALRPSPKGVEVAVTPEELNGLLAQPSMTAGWENYLELVGLDHILIAGSESAPELAGRTLRQVSDEEGVEPGGLLARVFERTGGRATIVLLELYDASRIEQIVQEPFGCLSTDSVHVALPHPRLYGTYPYAYSRFVRAGVISEADFVRRTVGIPSEIFGLSRSSLIQAGENADFLVIDPSLFGHEPDYLHPNGAVSGLRLQVIEGRVEMPQAEPPSNGLASVS